jgi:hypothetical protein
MVTITRRVLGPAYDRGAPAGFRIASGHPKRITVIAAQNGNACEEG